jgi:hypothetical protein
VNPFRGRLGQLAHRCIVNVRPSYVMRSQLSLQLIRPFDYDLIKTFRAANLYGQAQTEEI